MNVMKQIVYNDIDNLAKQGFERELMMRYDIDDATIKQLSGKIISCLPYKNHPEFIKLKTVDSKIRAIVGNPPWNNNVYVSIVENIVDKMHSGQKLVLVTPQKWLRDDDGKNLREKMMKTGCTKPAAKNNELVIGTPKEWKVKPGCISVFSFEKNLNREDCILRDKTPGFTGQTRKVLDKIQAKFGQRIKLVVGSFGGEPSLYDKHSAKTVKTDAVFRYGCIAMPQKKIGEFITNAAKNKNSILLSAEFTNVPFKNSSRAKVKQVVLTNPIPYHNTYVGIECKPNEINKLQKYLESTLVRFVIAAYSNNMHFSKSIDGQIPDVVEMLPTNFGDNDVYRLFNLTSEEIEIVKNGAMFFGRV